MELLKFKNDIKKYIEDRGIENLYHFTKADNLHGILKYGILSRKTLTEKEIRHVYNDNMRIEGRLDANCISIEFPNYRMFYKYRLENPESEWCVIELDSSILYEKNCLFCIENAASANELKRDDISKTGIEGLKRLYYNDAYRSQINLPNSFTTNPQAEVLVLADIELKYIKNIYFKNNPVSFPVYDYPTFTFFIWKYLFDARLDYEYWR